MTDGLDDAAALVGGAVALRPQVGVVLGSGLGGFADELEDAVELPYGEIPGWPVSTAVGHAGTLVAGTPSERYADPSFEPCAVICVGSCPDEWTRVRDLPLALQAAPLRLYLSP